MVKNGEKWPEIEALGKCWENEVYVSLSSFLFTDIIATAPSENFFVNTSRYGAKRWAKSRHT